MPQRICTNDDLEPGMIDFNYILFETHSHFTIWHFGQIENSILKTSKFRILFS